MKIQSISITQRYSAKGYDCNVTIAGDYQTVNLKLDEEHTQAVIAVVADLIVDGSKRIAEDLTRQALSVGAIEHLPEPIEPDEIPY